MNRKLVIALTLVMGLSPLTAFGQAAPALAAVSAAAASTNNSVTFNGPWAIITVDAADNVGQYASLAFDRDDDQPFVAYYDATSTQLRVAHPDQANGNCGPGGTWHCSTQPGFSAVQGQYPSAAFRTSGPLAVAYFDGTNGMNRYNGYLAPGDANPAWGVTVDNLPDLSGYPPTQTGRYNSMKFDGAGVAHIASQQSAPAPTGLRYAKYVGSGGSGCFVNGVDWKWACVTVDSGSDNTGAFASLDLSYLGSPRIAYRGPGGVLKLARYLGSGGNCGNSEWQCDVIDAGANTGNYISLFVPKCVPLQCNGVTSWIAYHDGANGRLKVAKYVGGNAGNCGFGSQADDWRCDVIETVGSAAAMGVSLAVQGGQPVIAYYDADDQANGTLKIAWPETPGNCGPLSGGQISFYTWTCATVDNGLRGLTSHNVGRYASLALDGNGLATIAYYDATVGDLLLAYQAPAPEFQVFVPIVVH